MDSNIRLFKKLNQCFNENVKLLFVNQFRVILIVTKDDKVYRLRDRFDGFIPLLALSDDRLEIDKLINESILENLCDKGVIDLKSSPSHTIALTIHGQIYCWGFNNYGQLGKGQQLSDNEYIDEPQLNVYLSENNIKISQICCGNDYSLALTKNGDVFAWGENTYGQIGNGDYKVVLIPYHINDFNERVKAISCGEWHSMALTESGHVFSWGHNGFGQLGVGDNLNRCKPKMIELNDILIEKISCGPSHSLLLSRDKDIYAFGENDVGQVGNPTQDNELTPFKISIQNKFIDIAAHNFYDFSAAQTTNDTYYVWGDCGQELNTEPKETNFKSFNEIFENYFQITYEPIKRTFIQFNYDFVENKMFEDKYEEVVEIGSGSYGQVFKVKEKSLRELSAIKKIKFKDEFENELLKELQISTVVLKLKDERVVKYTQFWIENSLIDNKSFTLYIEMELCDKTLTDIIDELNRNSFLNVNDCLTSLGYYIASDIFIEILEGVNYLHKHNVIHRDLKPDNILLKIVNENKILVKIADFGLITIHEFAEKLHEIDKGPMKYMAPEIDTDFSKKVVKYNTKADIFSFGVVLSNLFLIENERPYHNEDNESDLHSSKYENAKDLFNLMTKFDPNERPNCDQILETKHLWSFWEKEILDQIQKEFEKTSPQNYEQSFVYSLFQLKFPESNSFSH